MRDYIEGLKATDNISEYLLDNKSQTLKLAALLMVILTGVLLLLYRGGEDVEIVKGAGDSQIRQADGAYELEQQAGEDAADSQSGQTAADPASQPAGDIYVDIGGAVKSPMLAKLPAGSRIEDAITKAGGLTDDADLNTINRAEILVDGQKVYIPRSGEEGIQGLYGSGASGSTGAGSSGAAASAGTGAASSSGIGAAGKININLADSTQLQTITGIGPATAQKILDYRTQNGRFNTIEDLKNVSGIGDKTFEKMKDQVTV